MSKNWVSAVSAALLIALTGCVTAGRNQGIVSARVSSVDGSADLSRGKDGWESARLWQKVSTGDRARTGSDGKINFTLGNHGGVLTLMPDSLLEFEQLGVSEPDGRILAVLNLREGRIIGDTLKLPEGKRIQVKTRGGVHEIP